MLAKKCKKKKRSNFSSGGAQNGHPACLMSLLLANGLCCERF